MKDNYTYDYIHGTDVYIYQDKKMFRVNTDTALLAAFMRIEKDETVLDIGTNNGALLAVANRFFPSHIYGVDIQEEACALARLNMEHHNITNATILHGDVTQIALPKVDVIVCNPPYFNTELTGHRNASLSLQIARHETYLTLDQLASRVSSLLEEKGRFYMVHRSARFIDIACTLRTHRLEIRSVQFIYDEHKEEAIGILVEAIKDGKVNCHVLAPHIVKRT